MGPERRFHLRGRGLHIAAAQPIKHAAHGLLRVLEHRVVGDHVEGIAPSHDVANEREVFHPPFDDGLHGGGGGNVLAFLARRFLRFALHRVETIKRSHILPPRPHGRDDLVDVRAVRADQTRNKHLDRMAFSLFGDQVRPGARIGICPVIDALPEIGLPKPRGVRVLDRRLPIARERISDRRKPRGLQELHPHGSSRPLRTGDDDHLQ